MGDELCAPCGLGRVLAALLRAGWSEAAYLSANPDLPADFATPGRAAAHFVLSAKVERRRFPVRLGGEGMRALHDLPLADRALTAALLASVADAAADMGLLPQVDQLRQLWPDLIDLRRLGGRPYLVVGDSHSTMYRRSAVLNEAWLVPMHVSCTAGSAIGLANTQSRSGYRGQLLALGRLLAELDVGTTAPVMVQFGQVDLEFVLPFQLVRRGATHCDDAEFDAFCQRSVGAYVECLTEMFRPAARSGVHVMGVFPPALKDTPLRRGYVNGVVAHFEEMDAAEDLRLALQRLQWPDQPARTARHAAYNAALQTAAQAAGFGFASDFDRLLNGGPTLDDRFICHHQGEDHHLDFAPAAAVMSETIWRLVQAHGAPP